MRGVAFLLFHPKRLVTLVGGVFAASAYVWIAAVHAVPRVRRRKAAARRAWQSRPGRSQNVA
ncbi:MAG TPA: hypothetical protein VLA22_01325 [Gaiellaceae bacterium]|nr:hypothetical protein [Gaiellaceae bacterium]